MKLKWIAQTQSSDQISGHYPDSPGLLQCAVIYEKCCQLMFALMTDLSEGGGEMLNVSPLPWQVSDEVLLHLSARLLAARSS